MSDKKLSKEAIENILAPIWEAKKREEKAKKREEKVRRIPVAIKTDRVCDCPHCEDLPRITIDSICLTSPDQVDLVVDQLVKARTALWGPR